MVECQDGTVSMSGGISGACSDHGGEKQAVYALASSTTTTTVATSSSPASGGASSTSPGQLALTGVGTWVQWLVLLGGLLIAGATVVRWRLIRLATRRTGDSGH
jgi:LPXTG-motif cell wall-anchored protein